MDMSHEPRVEIIEGTPEEILALVLEGIRGIGTRLSTIEEKVDNVEEKVDNVDAKVDNIETKVNKIQAKVDWFETKIEEADQMDRGQIAHPQTPRTLSWCEVTIGYGSTVRAKKGRAPGLTTSGLSERVQKLIEDSDMEGTEHRQFSIDANQLRPTICWMSLVHESKEWPQRMEEPRVKSDRDIQKWKDWWSTLWEDTTLECPQCQFRRSHGEHDISCFYFKNKSTISVLMEVDDN